MKALDRIPDNALSAELRHRVTETIELKGSFQAIGSQSVRAHRIFSPADYDVQFTASSTPGATIVHQVDIEFVPDDMTFGGAYCHKVLVKALDLTGHAFTWIDVQDNSERRITSDGRQVWSFYYVSFGYSADSVRLKFYLFTTGAGTFTTNVVT